MSGRLVESKQETPAAKAAGALSDLNDGQSSGRSAIGTQCRNEYCFAPDTPCHMGDLDLRACENWKPEAAEGLSTLTDGDRPPWSGLALGSVDSSAVAATGRPRVVALVGAANAGKTSALAAYFIRLRQGYSSGGLNFAGSYTLLGWDQIAHYAEFPPSGSRGFPPHTTSGRSPALLHVRLASSPRRFYDVFFTDVPGEWFAEWAFEVGDAPGAQWIADRADLFVVLSDTDALSGPDRGRARISYQALASRVASVANGREIYPVRAKVDLSGPEVVAQAIDLTDLELFGVTAAPLSVVAQSPVPDPLHPLDEIIRRATAPRFLTSLEPTQHSDPFLGFRQRLVPT